MTVPDNNTLGNRPKIGIIGSGIAGLGCAYLLHRLADVTVFEKQSRIGGHSNTVNVIKEDGTEQPVDTGFMVYNTVTYPNLCRLFDELGVQGLATDMSFSVFHQPDNLVWCGSSINQIFGQRRNIFRPDFWRMVSDLKRLCADADEDLNHPSISSWRIRDYIAHKGFSEYLTRWFMLPMASAIWSTHPERILDFPARTLLRFYQNHRFLRLGGHLQWYTVPGGSQTYVRKLMAPFQSSIITANGAKAVWNENIGDRPVACVQDNNGQTHPFDAVILAAHADESLSIIQDATSEEIRLLSQFPYEKNTAILHTDTSVMPPISRCWAAWNYSYTGSPSDEPSQAATHYWMNRLQHISGQKNYIVSINGESSIRSESILAEIPYTHPRFTTEGIAVQDQLLQLNVHPYKKRFFCGSYFKYGFHEDAFTSATHCAQSVVDNLSSVFKSLAQVNVWP